MYSPQNDAQERSFATSTSDLMGNEPHQHKYRFTVNIYRIFSTGQHRPTLKPAYSVKGPQITYLARIQRIEACFPSLENAALMVWNKASRPPITNHKASSGMQPTKLQAKRSIFKTTVRCHIDIYSF